jgi:hypothetical protein
LIAKKNDLDTTCIDDRINNTIKGPNFTDLVTVKKDFKFKEHNNLGD